MSALESKASPSSIDGCQPISAMPRQRPRPRGGAICRFEPGVGRVATFNEGCSLSEHAHPLRSVHANRASGATS
jgi:hypothetical protein